MNRAFILLVAFTACSPRPEPVPYHALDGDTISVGRGPHIRLARIDAPELPGHCRPQRVCVPGDPYLARDQLQTLLDDGQLVCVDEPTTRGRDPYGRRIAECWIGGRNISDAMLASGTVDYYRRSR